MRLAKFVIVGGVGAVISLTILWLLTELAGWHYLLSYTVAFTIVVSNNYLWNSLWTFKDKQSHLTGLGRYALISLSTLGVKELLLFVLTSVLGIWYMASAALLIISISLVNFILSRRYVWNKPKQSIA